MMKFGQKAKKTVRFADDTDPLLPKDGGEGPSRVEVRSHTDSESGSKGGASGGQEGAKDLIAVREMRKDFRIIERILAEEIRDLRGKLRDSKKTAQKQHAELVKIANNMLQALTVCTKTNEELLQKLKEIEEKKLLAPEENN